MNELQVFNFENNEVRTLTIEDEPFFVGSDVARTLGYNEPHKAIKRHVDEDDGMKHPITDIYGRNQNATVINESGLYALIFGSQLKSAKRFKRWVTSEVLPQIRRTGRYEAPKDPIEIMRLQFEALDQTNKEVKSLKNDVTYLKDEVKLEAGEYSYISKRINRKVSEIVDVFALASTNDIRAALFKDINNGVNEIAGIKTRTQLRQKHFNNVIDFINQWEPSTATLIKVRQISLNLSEADEEDY